MSEKNLHTLQLGTLRILDVTKLMLSFLLLVHAFPAKSQEINFGTYSSSYSVTVSDLVPGENLDFGSIFTNEGLKSIPLSNAKVLTIEGVRYLDVIVTITSDSKMTLNENPTCTEPSCSFDFTLQAAYANRNVNDINQAVAMVVNSNTASAQFAIVQRGNGPPAPPPRPVTEGFNPASFSSTAYLYIYGFVNVGNIQVGSYSSNININVSYD